MPVNIFQEGAASRRRESLREAVHNRPYDYGYPYGLNLQPESELHNRLRDEIRKRLQASHSQMQDRHERWRKIEWTLKAYVPLDAEEKRIKAQDPRKPVSIVIPVSYATRETLLTYMVAAFFGDAPLFPLEPRSPEDVVPVALLELLLEYQRQRKKWELALYTMWSDGFSYGLGAVTPRWWREYGFQSVKRDTGLTGLLRRMFLQTGEEKARVPIVSFEGNRLDAIDPWLFFPDTNAPAHQVEDMEYIGWLVRTNIPALMGEEKNTGNLFNCQYLAHMGGDARSAILRCGERDDRHADPHGANQTADVAWLYWNLVPADYGLGDGIYPEPWVFALAGDEVIVAAGRLELNHNRFPVVVCAPDTDGRDPMPVSRLEVGYGIQETVDWMISSHTRYVRKMANGAFAYDPSMYNAAALQAISETGGAVPTRRSTWGRSVKDGIMQFPFNDVTRGNVTDAEYLMGILQRVTGATDIVQGMMREGGERRSATEARGARSSALSRLEKTARMVSIQSMRDLGYMLASQTQQFMSEDTATRVLGRHTEQLTQIYGEYVRISPFDVLCEFDVVARDGTIPNPDNAEVMLNFIDRIAASPLAGSYNLDRMIQATARQLGIKDLAAFRMQATVLDNETLQNQLQAGNVVPVTGVAA